MTDKGTLRARILTLRKLVDEPFKRYAEKLVCDKLTKSDLFKRADTVMSYMDFRNEVPVELLNRACLDFGKNLLLPYCLDDQRMVAVKAEMLPDGTDQDRFGIKVPENALEKVVLPEKIDLVIVPGVVFNRQCYRIGYGKGFYDRYLSLLREDAVKIGVTYEFQIVDELFQEEYDVPVDLLVSEKGVVYHEHCRVGL